MLSEMERPLTIKLRGKVSDLYRSRRSFYGRQKLEEFVLLCSPVTLQWFSTQIRVILQVFKLPRISRYS